jgi:acyl-CoA oxidase
VSYCHHGIDNGFIIFDKYRIPKENQLDRFSGVDENGKYFTTIPKEDKRFATLLGALFGGRVSLSFCLSTTMINSLTIAIRYVLNRQCLAPASTCSIVKQNGWSFNNQRRIQI